MTDHRANAESSASAGRPGRRRRRWRLWGFRLGAVAVSFSLLGLIELLLMVFGCGRDVRLVIEVDGQPRQAKYQFNESVDLPYFGTISLGGPQERRFDLPKPTGTYRIIVFGASTVYGFPYPPELAFPQHLEVILEQQNDGMRFEVLNAGITGISSFSVADMVRQGLRADPDLIVVHAGHNEFYGPGGAASATIGVSPSLYPAAVQFRRLRLFQLLFELMGPKDTGQELPEMLPRDVGIPLDSPTVRLAERHYRANLDRMARMAQAANVPILLTSVAGNLRDQSPIRSLSRGDLTSRDKLHRQELFVRGEREATRAREGKDGAWEAALASFRQATEIDESSAIVAYRIAQCLESLQRWDEARAAFSRARDLDGCRFRAPGSFTGIVREVAKDEGDRRVFFVDVAAGLEELSGHKAPGHDWYLEHVHYSFEGHWQVGLLLSQFIYTEVLGREWDGDRVPSPERRNELLGVIDQDHVAACSFALQLLNTPPFNAAWDNRRQVEFITSRIRSAYSQLPHREQLRFAQLSMSQIGTDLLGELGTQYLSAGLRQEGLRLLERNVQRRPWSAEAHATLVRCLSEMGETARARDAATRLLELNPDSADTEPLLQTPRR